MSWDKLRLLAMDAGLGKWEGREDLRDRSRQHEIIEKPIISKIGRHHVVSGNLHTYRGKEPYQRAFKTSHEANFHAEKLHRNNQETIANRKEVQAERKKNAQAYIGNRRTRKGPDQGSLF
jgi:hypothetical protein